MFYLKEFVKSIGESVLSGLFFILFSCLLAFSLTHRIWIASTIEKVTPEKLVNPYFVTVMDGTVESSKIYSLISRIPGVLEVDDRESMRGKVKLESLVASLGEEYKLDSEMMNFKSFKIVLSPALSRDSLEFVRDQIVKSTGRDHLSATEIKYPEVAGVLKAHPFYEFLGKAGDWGIIGILIVLWIISYWPMYSVFRSRSYIIEKFQRKKMVASKSMGSGLGIIMIIFTGLGILNGTLKFFDIVILFSIFSIFWTFTMQDWKWKPTL